MTPNERQERDIRPDAGDVIDGLPPRPSPPEAPGPGLPPADLVDIPRVGDPGGIVPGGIDNVGDGDDVGGAIDRG